MLEKTLKPGSGQDRVDFCSSQEGHGQDPGVILCHLRSFFKNEEGISSWQRSDIVLPLVQW